MRRVKSYVDVNSPLADRDGWVYKNVHDHPVWVSHYRPITHAQRQLGNLIVWLFFAVAIGFSIVRYLDHHMTWTAAIIGLFVVVILSHWFGGPLGKLIKYGSAIFVFIYASPIIAVSTLAFVHDHTYTSKAMVVLIFGAAYLISAYFLFRWIFPRSYTDY